MLQQGSIFKVTETMFQRFDFQDLTTLLEVVKSY